MKTLFFASAAPDAPYPFNTRMQDLETRLKDLLEPATDHAAADLVVVVVDEFCPEVMRVVSARCEALRPLRVFCRDGIELPRVVSDRVANARCYGFQTLAVRPDPDNILKAYATLPDPIRYTEDGDIIGNIESLVARSQPKETVIRVVC
jgi:hypothetical protein